MTSTGIDAQTWMVLTGWDHTTQSIRKILETMLRERVQRARDGSNMEGYIDKPQSIDDIMGLYVDAAEALEYREIEGVVLGEPRAKLTQISILPAADGKVVFSMQFIEYPNGHKGDFTPGPSPRSMSFATQYFEQTA